MRKEGMQSLSMVSWLSTGTAAPDGNRLFLSPWYKHCLKGTVLGASITIHLYILRATSKGTGCCTSSCCSFSISEAALLSSFPFYYLIHILGNFSPEAWYVRPGLPFHKEVKFTKLSSFGKDWEETKLFLFHMSTWNSHSLLQEAFGRVPKESEEWTDKETHWIT